MSFLDTWAPTWSAKTEAERKQDRYTIYKENPEMYEFLTNMVTIFENELEIVEIDYGQRSEKSTERLAAP